MRKLTLQQLKDAKACPDQVKLFKRLFGTEVTPTVELAQQHGHLFDANFAARHFLSAEAREEFERVRGLALEEFERVRGPAWEEYFRVTRLAWEKYKRVRGPAREELDRVTGPAWEEYQRVTGPAREEYLRVTGPAWEEYNKICMVAFVQLYNPEKV